jgi:hypothetical protein
MFAAAAGNGSGAPRGSTRPKGVVVDLKNGNRLGRSPARDGAPLSALEMRALRSAARDGI